MGLQTTKSESCIYLGIGFGKIRQKTLPNGQKVNSETHGAKMQTTDKGDSWAIEYDRLSGVIRNIFYKEDPNFSNSFEVQIYDDQLFQLSLKDDSRFTFEFLKKLPNVDLSKPVEIAPFDFVSKEGKRQVGLTLIQDGVKIQSFYNTKENDKFVSLHGYPDPDKDMNWKDKDEVKIYTIKIKKFLKSEFDKRFEPVFKSNQNQQNKEADTKPEVTGEADSDLPF